MIEFQDKYIEDAGELIAKLEAVLLDFENNQNDEGIIQEIFRIMHTIKGSAGMFGYNRIAEYTHFLEDIYDLIRKKKLLINKEIIDLTFKSVDLLRLLLLSKESISEEEEELYNANLQLAQKYTDKEYSGEIIETTSSKKIGNTKKLIKVFFKPHKNILLRGINVDSVVDELKELGNHVIFNFIDDSIEIDGEDIINQYWEIFFSGSIEVEDINDVFLFMEDEEFLIETLNDDSDNSINSFISDTEAVKQKLSVNELKEKIKEIIAEEQAVEENEIPKATPEVEIKETKIVNTGGEESIRVPSQKLDSLLNLVSDLIIIHAEFETIAERLNDDTLAKSVKKLSKISRSFRDDVITTRLIPIAVLTTSMHRLVRDLSNKLEKEVQFITEGLQTELDKNIINRIENPIMHIIRNCLDHGIETPDERVKNDKPAKGVLRFIAFYSGASVFIQIQDDGKGIDKKIIKEKAISKGIIKYDEVLSDKQVYDLMFIPGFSTAKEITDVSGRGVGLDVVKNEITELHGEINIDSEIGLGTSFTFKLPLTLSIVDALVVKCKPYNILIPTGNILICKHIPEKTFDNKDMQYKFQDKCVPIKRLNELLGNNSKVNAFEILVIFSIYDELYGLLVDRIVNTIQAVIKPLGEMHKKQHLFIGASQMGDGSIAYVLDTNILLKLKS